MSNKTPEEILRELADKTSPSGEEKDRTDSDIDLSVLLSGEGELKNEQSDENRLADILSDSGTTDSAVSDRRKHEESESSSPEDMPSGGEEEVAKGGSLELDMPHKNEVNDDVKEILRDVINTNNGDSSSDASNTVVPVCEGRIKKSIFSFRNISFGIVAFSISSAMMLYSIGYDIFYTQQQDKVYDYSSQNLKNNYIALLREYNKQQKESHKDAGAEKETVGKVADNIDDAPENDRSSSPSPLRSAKVASVTGASSMHKPEGKRLNPHALAKKAVRYAIDEKWGKFKEIKRKLKDYPDYFKALSVIELGFKDETFEQAVSMLSNPKASDLMIDWLDAWSVKKGDVPIETRKLMLLVDRLDYPVGLGLVLVKRYAQEGKMDDALYVAKMIQKYNPDERVAKLIRKIENETN